MYNVNVYWGDIDKFVRELRQRWLNEKEKNLFKLD